MDAMVLPLAATESANISPRNCQIFQQNRPEAFEVPAQRSLEIIEVAREFAGAL
jgi:hypothetical protein